MRRAACSRLGHRLVRFLIPEIETTADMSTLQRCSEAHWFHGSDLMDISSENSIASRRLEQSTKKFKADNTYIDVWLLTEIILCEVVKSCPDLAKDLWNEEPALWRFLEKLCRWTLVSCMKKFCPEPKDIAIPVRDVKRDIEEIEGAERWVPAGPLGENVWRQVDRTRDLVQNFS